MLLIGLIIALIVLIIGSITDIQKREVLDYLSYGLIFVAFAVSGVYSVIAKEYYSIISTGFGFIIGLSIGFAMFYLGQWGGGDSKLIMGLGAIIGFNPFKALGEINLWLIFLLITILFVGGIYGLVWSSVLAIKNRKVFNKYFVKLYKQVQTARIIVNILVIIGCIITVWIIPSELKLFVIIILTAFFLIFYIWIFVRVIEKSCMIKTISIAKLTEGDWINKEIFIGKRYIAGPKDLGISKEQILLLKKHKIPTVQVKEGIPFIPAFLIAYIAILILYFIGAASYLGH